MVVCIIITVLVILWVCLYKRNNRKEEEAQKRRSEMAERMSRKVHDESRRERSHLWPNYESNVVTREDEVKHQIGSSYDHKPPTVASVRSAVSEPKSTNGIPDTVTGELDEKFSTFPNLTEKQLKEVEEMKIGDPVTLKFFKGRNAYVYTDGGVCIGVIEEADLIKNVGVENFEITLSKKRKRKVGGYNLTIHLKADREKVWEAAGKLVDRMLEADIRYEANWQSYYGQHGLNLGSKLSDMIIWAKNEALTQHSVSVERVIWWVKDSAKNDAVVAAGGISKYGNPYRVEDWDIENFCLKHNI